MFWQVEIENQNAENILYTSKQAARKRRLRRKLTWLSWWWRARAWRGSRRGWSSIYLSFTLPLHFERFGVLGGKTWAIRESAGSGAFRRLSFIEEPVLSVTFCAAVMCLLLCYAKLHTFESSALVILNASLTSSKSRVTAFFSSK